MCFKVTDEGRLGIKKNTLCVFKHWPDAVVLSNSSSV